MKKWDHFKKEDFACKCCGMNNTSDQLIDKLDEARDIAGIPFVVNCGCRCKKHNKEVKGEEDSSHLTGLAVDISAKTSEQKFKIVSALLKVGFVRIGVYKTFLHGDIDTSKPQSMLWHG